MATLARRSALNPVARLVLLLGASVLLNYVDRGAIGVAAPLMKSDLGLTATSFGLAVSAFFWIYAPVQLVLGWLCDRFSVYRLLAFATVLWSIRRSSWASSAALHRFSSCRCSWTRRKHRFSRRLQDHLPARPGRTARACKRRVAAALGLGRAVGTFVGGSIMAALAAPCSSFSDSPAHSRCSPGRPSCATCPTQRARARRWPVRRFVGRWSLWAMGIVHACGNYSFHFVLAWLPLYLVQQRGLTIMQMTMLATLLYVVQAISALILGNWSDRWTRSGRLRPACAEES